MKRVVLMFATILMAGCATTSSSPLRRSVASDPAALEPFRTAAAGVLYGQGFAKDLRGRIRFAAGNTISCVPVTPSTREWWNRTVLNGEMLESAVPEISEFERHTIADATGQFEFESLPAGEYFVYSWMQWQGGAYNLTYEGYLGAKVEARAAQRTRVIVQPVSYRRRGYKYRPLVPLVPLDEPSSADRRRP